jgi:enoyl-CoA hydratase/carnithine racemase
MSAESPPTHTTAAAPQPADASAPALVRVEQVDRVAVITLARPEKKNALTLAMYRAIVDALRDAEADAGIRVTLLQGSGGVFTAGNDLFDFMQSPPSSDDTPVFHLLRGLLHARKPVVAAVSGPAVGIGTTALLHCDLVYADATARFRMPFVDLGLCPEAASSLLLPLLAGPVRAAELLLLAEAFDATVAREIGLINAIVPDASAHALERAKLLATKAPAAVRVTKQLLRDHQRERVERAMRDEGALFLERLRSPEAAEAFQAFFQRRAPDFSRFS